MGFVPKESWLPRLRNGVDVGPRPASLHDRYVTLYKTFADSWRVTRQNQPVCLRAGNIDQDVYRSRLACREASVQAENRSSRFPEFQVHRRHASCQGGNDLPSRHRQGPV